MNWKRSFIRARTGKVSSSLRELYAECSDEERRLSAAFFERYPKGRGVGTLTAFEGISQDPGPLAFAKQVVGAASGDLGEALAAELGLTSQSNRGADSQSAAPRLVSALRLPAEKRVETSLDPAGTSARATGGEVHVAVSGGIDSWVLAALLNRLGSRVQGWYLESGLEGYCEREQVARFRDAIGIPCEHIRVTAEDFVESAAEFVAVTEAPIYNLHPVSKLLLAKGLARNGITSVVTGDGADQVMRHDWDCDLLPLTLTCFRSAGVTVVAPFLSERVVGLCGQRHPDKEPIRELARRLGVPVVAKRPTVFPDVALPGEEQVCAQGAPTVLRGTTELLLQAMEKRETCAASVG